MKSRLVKCLNTVVEAFLFLSTAIALLWLLKFSGIKWTADEFGPSLWETLLTMTKTWGPLFVPAASVIFVVKMLQTNIAHDVCGLLEPRLQAIVSGAIAKAMTDSLDKRIAEKMLLGIRSVYRGIAAYAGDNPDYWCMYEKSSRDFRDVSGVPTIDIPALP